MHSPPELRQLYQGISFCTPVSKKSAACELGHVLTPSINALCSQTVFQVGKQVIVARSVIMDVRMVVKQLPVEML
jgi:hypothetical protein